MIGREWKPGDVAMVSWRDNPAQRAMRSDRDDWRAIDGDDFEQTTSARPLVVIDPESVVFEGQGDDDANRIPEIVKCLRRIAEGDGGRNWRSTVCLRLADEFERQARVPKPPEPTGLGAVVEDAAGHRYLRCFGSEGYYVWRRSQDFDGCRFQFSELDVVRVLSEGVTA